MSRTFIATCRVNNITKSGRTDPTRTSSPCCRLLDKRSIDRVRKRHVAHTRPNHASETVDITRGLERDVAELIRGLGLPGMVNSRNDVSDVLTTALSAIVDEDVLRGACAHAVLGGSSSVRPPDRYACHHGP